MRFAEALTSLVYPLQELQDRISLEIPASYIKEENIHEATDQQSARYTIVTYNTERGEPDGDPMDVSTKVKRLAHDVMDNYDLQWELLPAKNARNTQEFVVVARWPQRKAGAADSLTALPLTVYVGDDIYNIATDGEVFLVLRNGEPLIADAPSPAYALGALAALAPTALDELQQTQGIPESAPQDFIAGLGTRLLDSPAIPDNAKEHFVQFYELTTLHDFGAQEDTE